MGKIYAQRVNPENVNTDNYYDADSAEADGIYIGGNSDFMEWDGIDVISLGHNIEDFNSDLYDLDADEDTEEEDYQDKLDEDLKYYFRKKDGSALTNSEKSELMDLAYEYSQCSTLKENEVLSKILSILDGVEYTSGTITGCSQGDWQEYICPKDQEYRMPFISAVYFNTGDEYAITTDKYDEEPDMMNITDDIYFDYTDLVREDDVKKWIADNSHVNPDDVVILEGEL